MSNCTSSWQLHWRHWGFNCPKLAKNIGKFLNLDFEQKKWVHLHFKTAFEKISSFMYYVMPLGTSRCVLSINQFDVRDRPIFRMYLQIRITFGLRWVGGFTETGCSDFKGNEKSVHRPSHRIASLAPIVKYRINESPSAYKFFWLRMIGFRCGWVSCNLNVVRICKSVQNIGRSLIC